MIQTEACGSPAPRLYKVHLYDPRQRVADSGVDVDLDAVSFDGSGSVNFALDQAKRQIEAECNNQHCYITGKLVRVVKINICADGDQEEIVEEYACGHSGVWSSWNVIESGMCPFPVCTEGTVAHNTLYRIHNCTGEEQTRQEISQQCEITQCTQWSGM